MEHGCCPVDPDKTTERYLRGRLSQAEADAFEAHYICCPRCSEPLQFTDRFVVAIRHVAERLRPVSSGSAAR
jgi:hypothetical protein